MIENSLIAEPLVSVCIPCYNGASFVADAIESALRQTHTNVEIIVVDDGSEDDSVRVLESFGDRIRFEAGPNRGACAARNRAFELSRGEFIQFLDADDKLDPGKLRRQLPALIAHEADMALCKIGLFGDERGERPEKRPHPDPTGDPFLYFVQYGIQTAAPLHRRSYVTRCGGFLEGLRRGQEFDFHLKLAALNPRIVMFDEILVWVRMHDQPRITHRKIDSSEVVRTLLQLCEFLDCHSAWTDDRCRWVAERLLKGSRSCFAGGDRELSRLGLKRAAEVWPAIVSTDRATRRWLTRLLGIELAESVVDWMRRVDPRRIRA